MPHYDLYVLCSECGALHPMGVGVHLNEGPVNEQSVGETYDEESLPPQLSAIRRRQTLCLKTGRRVVQDDLKKIFLVPVRVGPQRPQKLD